MIGCLGGLGRSLARWMLQRGARNFLFMSRSGDSKPAARSLVNDLKAEGANVHVVAGDVCTASEVQNLVDTALQRCGAVGGVVQAAMALDVKTFPQPPLLDKLPHSS